MKKSCMLVLAMLTCCALFLGAALPERPPENAFVFDYAQFLTRAQQAVLSERCAALYEQTGLELVVLTLPELVTDDPRGAVQALMTEWDIGGSSKTGVLLLAVRGSGLSLIAAGSGLQGILTQEQVSNLVQNKLQPAVSSGNGAEGIYQVTMELLQNLEKVDRQTLLSGRSGMLQQLAFILFIVLTLLVFFRTRRLTRKPRSQYREEAVYRPYAPSGVLQQDRYTDDADTNGFGGPGRYGDY